MKKAFITGITGQDGSYLAELLLSKGYEVHGMIRRSSSFSTGRIDHIFRDLHEPDLKLFLHYGDLSDSEQIGNIEQEIKPDEVYHLGAQTHVRVSFDMAEYTGNITGLGTTRLLEAIRRNKGNARFYQASSSEMFGASPPPQNELTPLNPLSPYAAAKVYAYHMTNNYREAYGLFACNGILFNHESVTAETPVIIRKDGLINILPIEEIVPHRQNPQSGKRYATIPNRLIEVWDHSKWVQVTCMTATWNENGKQVIRVSARGGSFAATSDHIAFLAGGKEIKTGDLHVGNKLQLATFPRAEEIVELTATEAWFLGVLVGDGYVSRDGKVRVTGNDERVISGAELAWEKLTGPNCRRSVAKSGFGNGTVSLIDMNGPREYGRYLRNQLYTERGQKKVPLRILNASQRMQVQFLRGFNVADGLKVGRSKYEFQSFKTSSPCLAAGLWWLSSIALRQRMILCTENRDGHIYYQINLGCPEDENPGKKGQHLRRDVREVVKVESLDYRGWLFDLATETGTFHVGIGDGWIHNSPRRGETFVTRKVTRAVASILAGTQKDLYLGILSARRDWGYAPEYVEANWSILQSSKPDNYVLGTGECHSVQEFVESAFSYAGLDWKEHVRTDSRYVRPLDPAELRADPTKAAGRLNWKAKIRFHDLVKIMVDADMRKLSLEPIGEGDNILAKTFPHRWWQVD